MIDQIPPEADSSGGLSVLVAPDSFKGSLDAAGAATAIAEGWGTVRPQDRLELLPMADGGEGTIDAVSAAKPGSLSQACDVTGPDGDTVHAEWLLTPDGTAVIEIARTSGITLSHLSAPLSATTAGLGELMRIAIEDPRTRRVWVCLGGSATTDAGAGALQALGVRFLDKNRQPIPPGGGGLRSLRSIDANGLAAHDADIACLVDVTTPLLGRRGAARMFAPQKGASPEEVNELEAALGHFASITRGAPGRPGAGAAGGTAYGLTTVLGASVVPGAEAIGRLLVLGRLIDRADLVIAGEGHFDEQSLHGKVVGHIIDLAHRARTETALVAGQIDAECQGLSRMVSLTSLAGSRELAMVEPQMWLREAGRELAQLSQDLRPG